MPSTTNFGWTTPADTDLVKDGASAIRTLGNGVDASFVDLKGGTTGQVLSKASNTDLDFTWIANDQGDITAVTAGTGLSGGGTSGAVTVSLDTASVYVVPSQSGQSGKYLTTNGTVASWGTVASGSYTSLASGSLSGNSLDLQSISSSYKQLRLILSDHYISSRGNLQLTFNNDTGTNYTTMGIGGYYSGTTFNPTASSATGWPANYGWIGNGNNNWTTAENAFLILDIPNYTNTSTFKVATELVYQRDNTGTALTWNSDWHLWRSTSAINRIIIKCEGARTFSGGTYELLGQN